VRWLGAVVWLLPASAAADLFVPVGAPPPTVRDRTVVLSRDASEQQLTERLVLQGPVSRLVHFRAFPTAPEVGDASPDSFAALDEVCATEPPFHHAVEARPLGPSAASRLFPESPAPPSPTAPPEASPLRAERRQVFAGAAESSTVAPSGFVLPAEVDRFLALNGAAPSHDVVRGLAFFLNRGWSLLGTVYVPRDDEGPHGIGPERFHFVTDQMTLPLFAPSPIERTTVYSLGREAWVPQQFAVEWSDRPWSPGPPPERAYLADCARRITPGSRRAETLDDALGTVPPTVVRYRWSPPGDRYVLTSFASRPPTPVPPRDPGHPMDLVLCVILGLSPLVFAPESWLLLWLQGRFRSGFGRRVWGVWPIVVGLYWGATLSGPARIAAAVPLLLAVWVWSRPLPASPTRFVRARFERRRATTDL
jgi:hypothetical protein